MSTNASTPARSLRAGATAIACVAAMALTATDEVRGAESALRLSGIDYERLCRETQDVPLVYAAIDPARINVWSTQESRRAGRYEQYSFASGRIDVREGHEMSLYHGLIHRTLDLIGESSWKYRDLRPHEDHEHWLIYFTLETHWPGEQWRQGAEPNPSTLSFAMEYWSLRASTYRRINAKAAVLAAESWCAINVGPPVPDYVVSLPHRRG